MRVDPPERLGRVADRRLQSIVAGDGPGVAHLAAAFTIERRLVDDDVDHIASARAVDPLPVLHQRDHLRLRLVGDIRSEEHTSELQSLMRISSAVFCLKKNNNNKKQKSRKCHNPKTT